MLKRIHPVDGLCGGVGFQDCRVSGTSSATGEVEDEHHKGDHEQDMNESAGNMKRESADPEQQEKNGDD